MALARCKGGTEVSHREILAAETAGNLPKAIAVLLQAAGRGDLTPGEAGRLAASVGEAGRAIELHDLARHPAQIMGPDRQCGPDCAPAIAERTPASDHVIQNLGTTNIPEASHYTVSHGGQMNRNQQIAVAVGASVILLMLIVPPFHVQIRDTTFNMGYAFILDPPKRGSITASVNVVMLLVQWVGALLLTALTFFTLKSSEKSGEGQAAPAPFRLAESPRQEVPTDVPVDQGKSFLGGQHHPWRRFFARTVDVSTIGSLLFVLLAFTVVAAMPAKADGFVKVLENPIIAGFLLYLVWLPAEAAFLALLGTTPAKWLFGIRVAHSNGESLSFLEALNRSFLVWVQGVGFGIPFFALFTQLFAYRRLTKTGTTLWDTSTNAIVTHQKWGVLRAAMCVAVVFAVLVLFLMVSMITTDGVSG